MLVNSFKLAFTIYITFLFLNNYAIFFSMWTFFSKDTANYINNLGKAAPLLLSTIRIYNEAFKKN